MVQNASDILEQMKNEKKKMKKRKGSEPPRVWDGLIKTDTKLPLEHPSRVSGTKRE